MKKTVVVDGGEYEPREIRTLDGIIKCFVDCTWVATYNPTLSTTFKCYINVQ